MTLDRGYTSTRDTLVESVSSSVRIHAKQPASYLRQFPSPIATLAHDVVAVLLEARPTRAISESGLFPHGRRAALGGYSQFRTPLHLGRAYAARGNAATAS